MASAAFSRDSVVTSIKNSMSSQIAALRELGLDPEQIAQLVFAATMTAGAHSGTSSVAGDVAKPAKTAKAPKEKKAKDPLAPKKPMNAGLADYNMRFDAWWSENQARLEAEWDAEGDAYAIVQADYESKLAEYEKAKEKAELKGKDFKKPEPRMHSKMSKPTAKIIFSQLPEQKERKAAAEVVAKAKAKEKAASKKSSKASSVASAAEVVVAPESEDDGEDWTPITKDGKDYIYNDQGHCYFFVNGEQGDWAGLYDAETDTLDDTIEQV